MPRSYSLILLAVAIGVAACTDDGEQAPMDVAAEIDIGDLSIDPDLDADLVPEDFSGEDMGDPGPETDSNDVSEEPEVVEPPDRDGDGVPDEEDRFPDDPCEATDQDGDGIGDAADRDRDGDGVENRWEWRMGNDPADPADFPADTDTDTDGVLDYADPFPLDETRSQDLDGDGLADDEDGDDDGDGIADEQELLDGTDPRGLIPPDYCAKSHLAGWYPGDFHSHTNYSEDAARQGGDDIDVWVAIHEYYEDPRFLAVHPEYEGRGLRFQAISDHGTAGGAYDPDFHSERLVLIPGDEISGAAEHANALNMLTHISNRPPGTQTYSERYEAALRQTHYQGGHFQANHPCIPGFLWTTSLEDIDALEVWNAVWGILRANTEEELDQAVAHIGAENPYIRPAIRRPATNGNMQALFLWETMLTAGRHVAPVGGSDRHMFFAPAHPTTWVHAQRLTRESIMEAVRHRRTVITRHPGAIRLETLLHVEGNDEPVWVGDEVSVGPDDLITLEVSIEHAAGATIQVVGGPILEDPTPEALLEAPGGTVLLSHRVPVESDDPYHWTAELTPEVPGWIYLRVLEPISLEGLSPASVELLQQAIEDIKTGVDDYFDFVDVLLPLLPVDEALGMIPCAEENWTSREELNVECFLVDQEPFYTFLLPEPLDLILNYWTGPGPEGDHALGALTGAFELRSW